MKKDICIPRCNNCMEVIDPRGKEYCDRCFQRLLDRIAELEGELNWIE